MTVTGIGKVPTDFTWLAGPQVFATRAVLDQHPEIPRATNLVVRLRDEGDVDRLAAIVEEHIGPSVPLPDLVEAGDRVTTSTQVERDGLNLFALAVMVAGVLLVGQAVVRTVHASAADAPTLAALGFDRRQLATALVVPILPRRSSPG